MQLYQAYNIHNIKSKPTHQVFMKESRYEEDDNTSRGFTVAHLRDRYVDVTHRPHVHGQVPSAPEHGDVVRIPPVPVELAVREVHQLAHQVEERVEAQVEEAQPDQMVRDLRIVLNVQINVTLSLYTRRTSVPGDLKKFNTRFILFNIYRYT